jgi:hypothetical protein
VHRLGGTRRTAASRLESRLIREVVVYPSERLTANVPRLNMPGCSIVPRGLGTSPRVRARAREGTVGFPGARAQPSGQPNDSLDGGWRTRASRKEGRGFESVRGLEEKTCRSRPLVSAETRPHRQTDS